MTSPLRGRAREEAILAAAADLVTEIGYDRVSVDAIAARARASKMTIYRKWPGKAPLIAEALRRRAERATPEIPDTGSLRGDLTYVVGAIANALVGRLSLIGLTEAVRGDAVLRDLVRDQIEQRSASDGARIARRAVARGEDVDPARIVPVLGVAVAQLFLATLLGGGPPDADEQRALVDTVLLPLVANQAKVT
ncbi:TetR/AcrR family transcriptional regulator [Micromonosporaceae bacterium Da 78-11]